MSKCAGAVIQLIVRSAGAVKGPVALDGLLDGKILIKAGKTKKKKKKPFWDILIQDKLVSIRALQLCCSSSLVRANGRPSGAQCAREWHQRRVGSLAANLTQFD